MTDIEQRAAVIREQIRTTQSSICRQAYRERLAKLLKEDES